MTKLSLLTQTKRRRNYQGKHVNFVGCINKTVGSFPPKPTKVTNNKHKVSESNMPIYIISFHMFNISTVPKMYIRLLIYFK